MIRLEDLQVFVSTVDAGSFSAAARRMNLSPAVASSAIQRLEQGLDARLFIRSTRKLRLSEDGERYLPHARATLAAIEAGRSTLEAGRGDVSGLLRISAPSDLGRNVLLPWLDEFQARHPRLKLQLNLSDRPADFYQQAVDGAVRYGIPPDSGLIAQPLAADNRRQLCASPDYLARRGTPDCVEALARHNCLCFVWGDQILDRWTFHGPRGPQSVTVAGDRSSDDADVVRRWAVAGLGLCYKSRLDLIDDIRAGRLIEIFPPEHGEPTPLNLVCAHRSMLSPALQRLRDYLRDRCATMTTMPEAASSVS